MGLLKAYCNTNETTRQLDVLFAEARAQVGSGRAKLAPRPPRAAATGKRLPPEKAQAIVERYRSGERVVEIARELQLHKTTVMTHLNRAGVKRRPKGLTAAQAKQAEALYASGSSLATIGKRFDVSPTTIRNILLRRDVTIRDPHGRPRWLCSCRPLRCFHQSNAKAR